MSFTPATAPFAWQHHGIINEYQRAAREREAVIQAARGFPVGTYTTGFPDVDSHDGVDATGSGGGAAPTNPALPFDHVQYASFWAKLQQFIKDNYTYFYNPYPVSPGSKVYPPDYYNWYPSMPQTGAGHPSFEEGDSTYSKTGAGGDTFVVPFKHYTSFSNFMVSCGIPAGDFTRILPNCTHGTTDHVSTGLMQSGDIIRAINFQELQKCFKGMVWGADTLYQYALCDMQSRSGLCDHSGDAAMIAAAKSWAGSKGYTASVLAAATWGSDSSIFVQTQQSYSTLPPGGPWWFTSAARGRGRVKVYAGSSFAKAGQVCFFWVAQRTDGYNNQDPDDISTYEPANKTDLIASSYWTGDVNGEPYTNWAYLGSITLSVAGSTGTAKKPDDGTYLNDGTVPAWNPANPNSLGGFPDNLSAAIAGVSGLVMYDVPGAFEYYD